MITDYLRKLSDDGLKINTVYDVGACEGVFTYQIRDVLGHNTKFFLFEANKDLETKLKSTGYPYFLGVLSDPGRTFVEFYSKVSTGDSYYKENTYHFDNMEPTLVPCRTLDSLVNEFNLPIPNLLKIDTQGSEIDILKGAESILQNIDLVYLETPFMEYNFGAPSLEQYLSFMRDNNFIPVEIIDIQRCENTVFQLDIMFMNYKTKCRLYGPNKNIRALKNI